MTNIKDTIQHPGIIEGIGEDKVQVNILSQSACSSCHSKGMCTVAEMENKTVDVTKMPDFNYKVGDEVIVYMKKSLGRKAVYYGYLFPFLLMFGTLVLVLWLTSNEGLAALSSLLLLIPYYYILYKIKDKLSTTFEFKIL